VESLEHIPASDLPVGDCPRVESGFGRFKIQAPMRSGPAAMLDIRGEGAFYVTPAEDEDVVEALSSSGTDPALGKRIRARRADGSLHCRNSFRAETLSSKGPENLASRSRSKRCLPASTPIIERFRACLVTQAESGRLVVPVTRTRLDESSTKNRT
jgi:hypothetical protein